MPRILPHMWAGWLACLASFAFGIVVMHCIVRFCGLPHLADFFHGSDSPLHDAAARGDIGEVEAIAQSWGGLHEKNDTGHTALQVFFFLFF